MTSPPHKPRLNFRTFASTGFLCCCAMFLAARARPENFAFTNSVAQAALAEKAGDFPAALKIFGEAEVLESNNAVNLCVLARSYCDLMYLTNSTPAEKDLLDRALACAVQAVKAAPNNSTAHACVAVCCAKACAFAGIKNKLAYSRRFKREAEESIKLDPRQDIAYYLLGRWNYEIANVGLLSRAFVKVVYGGLPPASNEDAINNFQKAIALVPNRIIHHAGLAMVYETTGQTKLKIAELEKCRDLKPLDREDANAQREAERKLASLGP